MVSNTRFGANVSLSITQRAPTWGLRAQGQRTDPCGGAASARRQRGAPSLCEPPPPSPSAPRAPARDSATNGGALIGDDTRKVFALDFHRPPDLPPCEAAHRLAQCGKVGFVVTRARTGRPPMLGISAAESDCRRAGAPRQHLCTYRADTRGRHLGIGHAVLPTHSLLYRGGLQRADIMRPGHAPAQSSDEL
jgi:hypothetical protein